jgi:hypothetical protein
MYYKCFNVFLLRFINKIRTPATPTAKKRRMADENRVFQSKLTKEYFFGCGNDVAICLVCNRKVSYFKE